VVSARTLSRHSKINACPPKPGFTVSTSKMSKRSRKGLTRSMTVGGLIARPALQPAERMPWRVSATSWSAST
jgi:hypothetical protein